MKAYEKLNKRLLELTGKGYDYFKTSFETMCPMAFMDGDVPVVITLYIGSSRWVRYMEVQFPSLTEIEQQNMYEDPRLFEKGQYIDSHCMYDFVHWVEHTHSLMDSLLYYKDLKTMYRDFGTNFIFYRDDDDPREIEFRESIVKK